MGVTLPSVVTSTVMSSVPIRVPPLTWSWNVYVPGSRGMIAVCTDAESTIEMMSGSTSVVHRNVSGSPSASELLAPSRKKLTPRAAA